MAEFLENSEIFFTNFAPQLKHRFIMYIEGIPSFTIKAASKPNYSVNPVELPHMNTTRYVAGKLVWQPIDFRCYAPIVPSVSQALMEWTRTMYESVTGRAGYPDFYQKDVVLQTVGPVGDIVERWVLKQAFLASANFGDFDFGDDGPQEISGQIQYSYAVLEF